MQKGDFALIEKEQSLVFNASTEAILFAIEAPAPAPYQTYAACEALSKTRHKIAGSSCELASAGSSTVRSSQETRGTGTSRGCSRRNHISYIGLTMHSSIVRPNSTELTGANAPHPSPT
jgi:hypothetical protein